MVLLGRDGSRCGALPATKGIAPTYYAGNDYARSLKYASPKVKQRQSRSR
ncbi:MAG: hypothetical protein ACLS6O_01535 [Bifidobacterium sp.]